MDFRNTPYTRGIRNNNPGNLEKRTTDWQGKVPHPQNTDSRFEQFDTIEHGLRALMINVHTKVTRENHQRMGTSYREQHTRLHRPRKQGIRHKPHRAPYSRQLHKGLLHHHCASHSPDRVPPRPHPHTRQQLPSRLRYDTISQKIIKKKVIISGSGLLLIVGGYLLYRHFKLKK